MLVSAPISPPNRKDENVLYIYMYKSSFYQFLTHNPKEIIEKISYVARQTLLKHCNLMNFLSF